jgi:hypothetical protein
MMSDTAKIDDRVVKQAGIPELKSVLASLAPSDLHSILLGLYKTRVAKVSPPQLLREDSVAQPSTLDARVLHRLEAIAFEVAALFDAVELSPVLPLGAVSALTKLDQGNILSTIRAYECSSDSTVGMALEAARRRKDPDKRAEKLRLCCSQRVLRFPAPTTPGYSAHFQLFTLVTAGRDAGSFRFELDVLREQIEFYLAFLTALQAAGWKTKPDTVEISDTRLVASLCARFGISEDAIRSTVRARDAKSADKVWSNYSEVWPQNPKDLSALSDYGVPAPLCTQAKLLEDQVLNVCAAKYPDVSFKFNWHRLTGLNYYTGPCFHIKCKNKTGDDLMIPDGGFTDWTKVLLQDKKERLLTSGIGIELIGKLLGP